MVRQLSVLVEGGPIADLERVIASLDAQSLSIEAFDVLVVDRGLAPQVRGWLDLLTARRPNVAVVAGEDSAVADLAERVAVVETDHRLFPEALERMLRLGDRHGADIVAGRVSRRRLPLTHPFVADQVVSDGNSRRLALRHSLLLTDRSLIRIEPAGLAVDAGDRVVAVMAGYPAARSDRDPAGHRLPASVATGGVAWDGDELAVSTEIRAATIDPHARPFLVLRQPATGLTIPVEAAGWDRSGWPDGSQICTAQFAVSPATAGAGGPLTGGVWTASVVLVSESGSWTAGPLRVPVLPPPAVLELDGAPRIVTFGSGRRGAVQIDVGATQQPLLRGPDPRDARVTESVSGSQLALALPDLHVCTTARMPGAIALDRFQFPATLATADEQAVVTAQLSGLPGSAELSARFGGAPMSPTGLSVVIAADGAMRLVATGELPARKDPTDASRSSIAPAPGSEQARGEASNGEAAGPIARLRRALPASLEPVARRLRSNKTARAVYRRLTGLGR